VYIFFFLDGWFFAIETSWLPSGINTSVFTSGHSHLAQSPFLTLTAKYAEQGLCSGRVSVRLSYRSTAVAVCSGFAAELPAGKTSIDSGGRPAATAPQHGAQQQIRAVSC